MYDMPELEGFWWVPGISERQLQGRLVADNDSAKLVLTVDSPVAPVFSREIKKYEVVHGRATTGQPVSLLQCVEIDSSWSSSGIERRVVLADYVLVGGLVPIDLLDSAFTELSLKWSALKHWFDKSGIDFNYTSEDFRSFQISYNSREPISIQYGDDIRIEIAFTPDKIPNSGLFLEGVSFSEVVWVTVTPSKPKGLHFYLGLLEEIKHFFSLCLLEYIEPEAVSLVGNFPFERPNGGEIRPPFLRLYGPSFREPQSASLLHPRETLLPYSSVSRYLEATLQGWHRVADKISPSRNLYFSSLPGRNRYIETSFLALAQAAEVFHRRQYDGGTYLADEYYKTNIMPAMSSAIPADIDSEVRTVLKQKLAFLNEYSLGKRLKEMAKNHKRVFEEYVPDWKNWESTIRDIVQARNYYTHYSESSGQTPPEIKSLVNDCGFLRMLLELEMLRATGLDLAVLHNRTIKCERYRSRFYE